LTYVSVGDVRNFNTWSPIPVYGDTLTARNPTLYQTTRFPIVDFDFDGVVEDDVVVYDNNNAVSFTLVSPERGLISLTSPPSGPVTANS